MEEKKSLLFYHILDPISFFQEVDECKGAIYVKSYKGLQDLRKNYFMQCQLSNRCVKDTYTLHYMHFKYEFLIAYPEI